MIAPATANVVGKLAAGIADDLLTTVVLATQAPLLVVPSMNVHMLAHPMVQANLAKLRDAGYHVMESDAGYLACGYEGKGRLPEPPAIVEEIRRAAKAQGPGGREDRRHRRAEPGSSRPGPLHLQPVVREDGLRPGAGGRHGAAPR